MIALQTTLRNKAIAAATVVRAVALTFQPKTELTAQIINVQNSAGNTDTIATPNSAALERTVRSGINAAATEPERTLVKSSGKIFIQPFPS